MKIWEPEVKKEPLAVSLTSNSRGNWAIRQKSRENEGSSKNQSKSLQTSTTKPHQEEQGGNIRRESTSPWRATRSSSKPL